MGGPWQKVYRLQFSGNDEEAAAFLYRRHGEKQFRKLSEANAVRDAVVFLFPEVRVRRLSIDPRPPATALD
jgi:hypothetical protein